MVAAIVPPGAKPPTAWPSAFAGQPTPPSTTRPPAEPKQQAKPKKSAPTAPIAPTTASTDLRSKAESKPAVREETKDDHTAQGDPAAAATLVAHRAVQSTAAAQPAPVLPTDAKELMGVLSKAPSAEEREMAAHTLGALDGPIDPAVIEGLLTAARRDQSPVVRAASIRALARLNIRTAPVLSTMLKLWNDPNALIRAEAERAYRLLTNSDVKAASAPAE